MTRASASRLARKYMLQAKNRRNFTPEETMELGEISRIVNSRVWEYNQVAGNTALIPEGQKLAEQLKAVATVLDQAKRTWVAQKLAECGYAANTLCDINLNTGEIYPKTAPAYGPQDDTKAA